MQKPTLEEALKLAEEVKEWEFEIESEREMQDLDYCEEENPVDVIRYDMNFFIGNVDSIEITLRYLHVKKQRLFYGVDIEDSFNIFLNDKKKDIFADYNFDSRIEALYKKIKEQNKHKKPRNVSDISKSIF
jgi:hypothetical protein